MKQMDSREIDGLWCDDITFCQEDCERMDCPRNKHHIRDKRVPHSFSVEIPQDCLKQVKKVDSTANLKKHLRIQIKTADQLGSQFVYILKSEAKKCLELAETDDVVSLDERIKICRILFNRCYVEHGNYLCQYCTFKAVCDKERDHDTKRNS